MLRIDNQSAISVAKHPEHHGRMKQLDLSWYWLRDVVHKELIAPTFVPTADQPADILTKSLAKPKVELFCGMMGLGRCWGELLNMRDVFSQGGVLVVWTFGPIYLLKYLIWSCTALPLVHWLSSPRSVLVRYIIITVHWLSSPRVIWIVKRLMAKRSDGSVWDGIHSSWPLRA